MSSPAADSVLEGFHPLVRGWFRERFGAPTAPQAGGWPHIAAGRDVLIAAPTGSGKTLAAFLACLDELVRDGLRAPLADATRVVYVSPLKALSNDIQRNLQAPLGELARRAASEAIRLPDIRVGVRTGDTPLAERDKMAKRPPHILVTTPESLYILLTTERGRKALGSVRTVILDEIHAIAGDKRGAHLALTLERLDRLVARERGRAPTRVGLSATQRPIERIGRLLVGSDRPMPTIIDSGHRRDLDLAIEINDDELGAVASLEQMGRVYDRIAALVAAHRTTLVFVNTRRMVERVAAALEDRLGAEDVVAHHGSMSRELRLAAEEKLKHGQVRCAVATASLELGIDVGAVDLVVQLGSPRAISTLLQRIGRSGHHLGGTPKGRLFALTRDQLVECAALIRGVRKGSLDEIALRDGPLDILAQQVVATVAAEDEVNEEELFALVRRAAQYHDLERARFEQVLELLADGASERRGRMGSHLHRDRVGGRLKARRGARLAAITSGGAIPDTANYAVLQLPEQIRIGEVDEDFAIDSSPGDIFQLGNTSWQIVRIEAGKVLVADARGLPPTIPFWFGEAPARTRELSDEVSALRRDLDDRLGAGALPEELAAELVAQTSMSMDAAHQVVRYLAASRVALGALPSKELVIAERFFDEGGGMQLVLHSPFGGRINRAWGLALRKRFCRSFNFELQAAATDDGIVISLGQPHSFPLDTVFGFLPSHQAEEVLVQALLDAPMFEVRWRWNVTRSLTVLRRFGGKKVAPHLLRMRAADLLSVVFPQAQACLETVVGDREIPDHPLVFETIRDCLVEAMDMDGFRDLLGAIETGQVRVLGKDSVEPSPLCHELLNANPYAFLDDAPLEERRTRAVSLRRGLPDAEVASHGALDAAAIDAAEAEVAPVVRDADELHDALLSLWLVPRGQGVALAPEAARWMEELAACGRATSLRWQRLAAPRDAGEEAEAGEPTSFEAWVSLEKLAAVHALLPTATFDPPLEIPGWSKPLDAEAAAIKVVGAHLDHGRPRTAAALAAHLGLTEAAVVAALLALEADGAVLRGRFTNRPDDQARALRDAMARHDDPAVRREIEWANRRILARIHRLTLGRLRAEIEPVSAAALQRFLLRWQRVARGCQVIGGDGLLRVVEQLQGFESAAGAWEREIFPARLASYDPALLDQLCLAGHVVWCRLSRRGRLGVELDGDDIEGAVLAGVGSASPLPAERGEGRGGGSAPSRAAPLALMIREHAAWLRAPAALRDGEREINGESLTGEVRAVWEHLSRHGASFLSDLVTSTGLSAEAVEDALWDLVGEGVASADGFASMRVLVDRHRGESRSNFDRARPTPSQTRRWQEVVKDARGRDRARPRHALRALPTAAGRWALLGAPRADQVSAEATARQLLARYGVVFRDLLTRESCLPPWRELAMALRRLEARGEIRGGRFVSGFVGEQFALPEAVDQLRAVRNPGRAPETVVVAATDPLNLVGILVPGPRVPAVIGNAILYVDGVAVASREAGELVVRSALATGARVDPDLTYHPPPRREPVGAQAALPL